MWKYVSRRVKDTIELGINVRKSFTIQQSLNNSSSQQQQQNEKFQNSLRYHQIVPRHQDPSWRERAGSDGKFKQKYHKLNEHRCFLNALTWVRTRFGLETQFVSNFFFLYFQTVDRHHNRFLRVPASMLVSTQPALSCRGHKRLLLQILAEHNTVNPPQCAVFAYSGRTEVISSINQELRMSIQESSNRKRSPAEAKSPKSIG